MSSLSQVHLLTRLIGGFLARHERAETELVFSTMNHVLAERGQLRNFNHEHEEVDRHVAHISEASNVPQARLRLREAIRRIRKHYQHEEEFLFPLAERLLSPGALEELGAHYWQNPAEA